MDIELQSAEALVKINYGWEFTESLGILSDSATAVSHSFMRTENYIYE